MKKSGRCEAEKGQAVEDRALSRHLAEANRDQEEEKCRERVRAVTSRKKGRVAKLFLVWVKTLCPQVIMLQCERK